MTANLRRIIYIMSNGGRRAHCTPVVTWGLRGMREALGVVGLVEAGGESEGRELRGGRGESERERERGERGGAHTSRAGAGAWAGGGEGAKQLPAARVF